MGRFGITEAQYDYVASRIDDDDLTFICKTILLKRITWGHKRKLIQLKQKYLDDMKNNC
jgi:hypothetical protein